MAPCSYRSDWNQTRLTPSPYPAMNTQTQTESPMVRLCSKLESTITKAQDELDALKAENEALREALSGLIEFSEGTAADEAEPLHEAARAALALSKDRLQVSP